MKFRLTAALAVTLTAIPTAGVAAAAADRGGLPADVPVTLAGTQILVDGVRVNGRGPFRFLLDTGAMGDGRVDASLVEALGLRPAGEVRAGDGTSRRPRTMPIYHLDRLDVGPLTFRDVRVMSRDYNRHGAAVRGHIDGVLGFGLFRDVLLTIDYPARALRLEEGRLGAGAPDVVRSHADAIPRIDVLLAGRRHAARLDTGSMGPVSVGADVAGALPLAGEPVQVGEARTLSGAFAIRGAPLDGDLRLGPHAVENPDIVIAPPLRGVNIGGAVLREFAVTFDQRSDLVRFVRPEPTRPDGAPRRTRLGLEPVGAPLRMERGRPVVDAMIDGRGPYPFVVDTGAGAVILAPGLVEDLGLESEGTQRVGDPSAPDAIEADTFTLANLRIGDARFEGVEAISWPGDMLERSLGSARGIIGLPVFVDCLVTLDFPGNRLTIRRGALGPADGSVAYALDGWVPALPLRIGEATVEVHLDTGNPGVLVLPERLSADLDLAAPPRVVGRARTASGAFQIKRAPLTGTVRLAGREIALPAVDLTDRFDHANAGSGLLSRFALTIDQTNQRVLLAAPGLTPARP